MDSKIPAHVKVLQYVPGIPEVKRKCLEGTSEKSTEYHCRKLASIVEVAKTPKSAMSGVAYLEANKNRCTDQKAWDEHYHISRLLEYTHGVKTTIAEQGKFTRYVNNLCKDK